MLSLKYFVLLFVLVKLSATSLFGQDESSVAQKNAWLLRAETITSSLLKETTKVDELERALLFAQLGDEWRKSDQVKSDQWFEKSVDSISFYSLNQPSSDKNKFFKTARQVLSVISNRNRKQSERLTQLLMEAKTEIKSDQDNNSDALVENALRIVKENPNQAAALGTAAVKLGNPKEIYKLIWELRRNNSTLADSVFNPLFSAARFSLDYTMLQNVQLAAFPEAYLQNFPSNLQSPNRQKIEVLDFFADYIAVQQNKFVSRTIIKCSNEAVLVDRLKIQFAALLPQKAGIAHQAVGICLTDQKSKISSNVDVIKNATIEELLSLADENKDDSLLRRAALMKAAILASNQKKYALVLKIVNNLTEEERLDDQELWDSMHFESAGFLAYQQYRDKDFQGSNKTLRDVPAAIRPISQIVFVQQFQLADNQNYNFLTDVLSDARKGFIASEAPFAQKSDYWFRLVKIYST